MSIASVAKPVAGVVLALLLGCEPVPGSVLDGGSTTDGAATTTSNLQPIGANALCQKLVGECGLGLTQAVCLNQYFPLRVTADCVRAVPTATCADLASTTSSLSQTCFPPCQAGAEPVCNSDGTLTVCSDANTLNVLDCRDTCSANGFTSWTGACGKTFDGQVAVRAQCWCR